MAASRGGPYAVSLSEGARDSWYRAEPRALREAIWEALESLEGNPRPDGALQLVGSSRYWWAKEEALILYAIDEKARRVLVTEIRL